MTSEPTTAELLKVIEKGFEQTNKRFGQMDDRFETINRRFETIDKHFVTIDQRFEQTNQRIDDVLEAISEFSSRMDERLNVSESDLKQVKSQMVTKSYLDDKLTDLRDELIALTRKTNVKLSVLVETLVKDGSMKQKTADFILAMEPFAQS